VAAAREEGDAKEDGDASPLREERDEDEPQFDLVTGTYRTRKVFNDGRQQQEQNDMITSAAEGVTAMTLRNNDFTLAKLESAGSNYLASREWKGLEARYGMDEPAVLEEGRSGIARGYGEEK
jgi:diphthamide biosynthesis protein 2